MLKSEALVWRLPVFDILNRKQKQIPALVELFTNNDDAYSLIPITGLLISCLPILYENVSRMF